MVDVVAEIPRYAEFFCGGGMVRAALGDGWNCALANDIDPMKCAVYADNYSSKGLVEGDIRHLDPDLLKQPIDLFWASSPCQDFSLAGKGRGLAGERSGVFDVWADKVAQAVKDGFAPRIIAFENVTGLVTRKSGADFTHVLNRLVRMGYSTGVLEIDASYFVPQSRPRVFVVALRKDLRVDHLVQAEPEGVFHTRKIVKFYENADKALRDSWLWLKCPPVAHRNTELIDLIDEEPDTPWLSKREIARLQAMMSTPSSDRVAAALKSDKTVAGTLYKRGRPTKSGEIRQRAEVRFDGVAGCLRTPAGGSSRQTLLIAEKGELHARLLSSREAMRLMGLPESYTPPSRYNAAYKVFGDGVAVPIVRYLDQNIFQPVLVSERCRAAA